jgi:hypothetical protein
MLLPKYCGKWMVAFLLPSRLWHSGLFFPQVLETLLEQWRKDYYEQGFDFYEIREATGHARFSFEFEKQALPARG